MGKLRPNKRRSWNWRLHADKRPDNCLNIPGILCPLNTLSGHFTPLNRRSLIATSCVILMKRYRLSDFNHRFNHSLFSRR